MKRPVSFLICLSSLLMVFSCSKSNKEPELKGTWNWVQSSGGVAYQVSTPASTGTTMQIAFTPNSRYTVYTNGSISSEGIYSLENRRCIHDGVIKPVIKFSSGGLDMMIEHLTNRELELSQEAYDGFGSLYERK